MVTAAFFGGGACWGGLLVSAFLISPISTLKMLKSP